MRTVRRPVLGIALVGLGCFLVGLGLLARFYVFPHLAVLPLDRFEKTESRAQDAIYVDRSTGTQHTGRELIAINTLRGDVRASTDTIAVWESLTWTRDGATGGDVNFYETEVAMDRHTGRAVTCCGQHVERDSDFVRSGIAYQWPFYSEKTSYPFFDEVLKKTYPIKYEATEELFGLTVYRYEQHIAPTKLESLQVPGFLVGMAPAMVPVERWYGIDRTYWVEPRAGIVVKASNHRKETLRTAPGVDALTLFDANMVLTDKDVRRIVAEAEDASTQIALLHTGAFWTGIGLGAVLILAGAALIAARRPRPAVATQPARIAEAVT